MIYGIGIDLVEISRMAGMCEKYGDRFAEKILSKAELQRYRDSSKPENFLAKAFAVKEATAKALGTGLADGVSPSMIGWYNLESGKPCLEITEELAAHFDKRAITASHLSISDEAGLATAWVILESASNTNN